VNHTDKKKQFWDYMVTLNIRVSASSREQAKEIVDDEFVNPKHWPSPIQTVAITRIKPVAK